jgi:hypothetical protein
MKPRRYEDIYSRREDHQPRSLKLESGGLFALLDGPREKTVWAMEERGVSVDHATLNRWVITYAPEVAKQFRRHPRPVNRRLASQRGAHLLRQIRTPVLDKDLRARFPQWDPGMVDDSAPELHAASPQFSPSLSPPVPTGAYCVHSRKTMGGWARNSAQYCRSVVSTISGESSGSRHVTC